MKRAAKPLLVALCAAWSGCSDAGQQGIEYSSMDTTLGRWPGKTQQEPRTSMASMPTSPRSMDANTALDDDDDDAGARDNSSEVMLNAGTTGSGNPPAQSKPQPTSDAGSAAPARMLFSVLTEVQHMRLAKSDPGFDDDARGPKNMGAIWISRPDGTFVRSLEVWRLHKERARHLVGFNKICQCPKPDVTATATLSKHREHVARWDMTDRDGARVPEGNYTLHIEVADYDVDKPEKLDSNATNAQWSMDFDTRGAPSQLMPVPSEYFSNLKLELLTP